MPWIAPLFPAFFFVVGLVIYLRRRGNVRVEQLLEMGLVSNRIPDEPLTRVERGGVWIGKWSLTHPFVELRVYSNHLTFVLPELLPDRLKVVTLSRSDFRPRFPWALFGRSISFVIAETGEPVDIYFHHRSRDKVETVIREWWAHTPRTG